MGYKAINHVLKHSHSTGTRRVVMVVLAEKGIVSWPSLTTIAKLANVSRPAVKSAIKALVNAGEVLVIKPNKRRCIYVITCGLETKSIVKVLTTHSKIKWSTEDATTIANAITVMKYEAQRVNAAQHAEQILTISKARNAKKDSKGGLTTASKGGLTQNGKPALHEPSEPEVEPESTSKLTLATNDLAINSTPPIPTQNVSRTDAMEQKDALAFMFERAMLAKATPAETTIRKWNLPPQLSDLCLMFWQVTNQIVTPEDKGKWAAGAKRLVALLPHGLNQAAMERAYSVMQKDRMTCTHPGAIYEKCKEAIQQAQPKADDDSANWVYTPSGQRVRAQ